MRLGSFFSGIEGFGVAAHRQGIATVYTSEIEAFPRKVLQARFPDVPHFGDIAEIWGRDLPHADVLTGGSPCQDFSIAGLRAGLEGARSGLFAQYVRVIEEIEPRYAIWENVPGTLTSSKGEDIANVLSAMVGGSTPLRLPKHPKGRRSRYAGVAAGPRAKVAWRVLDAQHFGVAQRRQRLFVVRTKDWSCVDILFGPEAREHVLDAEADCGSVSSGFAWLLDYDTLPFETGMQPEDPEVVKLAEILEEDVDEKYYLSEKACLGILTRATRRGRALPEVLHQALWVQAGRPEEFRPSGAVAGDSATAVLGYRTHALTGEGFDASEDGTGRGTPIIAVDGVVPEFSKSLSSHPSRQDGTVETFIPVPFRKSQRAHAKDDHETWEPTDVSNTLNLFDFGGDVRATDIVAYAIEPESGQGADLRARATDASPAVTSNWTEKTTDRGVRVVSGYRVRRLTPTECSRLQGFPDSWLETCHADEAEAYAREVLQRLWFTATQEAGEGRRPGIAAPLLTPEVLLAGVHGGWIPWSLAGRCASAAREVQGEDAWPEGFMRRLREARAARPAPHRRESFEQLARELGRSVSEVPFEEAPVASRLRGTKLWEEAPSTWVLRHACPEVQEVGEPDGRDAGRCSCGGAVSSDSARYRALGNAVAVPVVEWILARVKRQHQAVRVVRRRSPKPRRRVVRRR